MIKLFSALFLIIAIWGGDSSFVINASKAAEPYVKPLEKSRPKKTSPAYVAMLYYKMTGQVPDFEQWAIASRSYTEASRFDKTLVQTEKVLELRSVYDLLTITEPIVVEMKLDLSQYSRSNEGFFITSFKEDTFFSFRFLDQNYAIIPTNIMDNQWMAVAEDRAEKILLHSRNQKGAIHLYLEPRFADKSAPLNLNGQDYWLIAADITRMAVFAPNSDKPIWESDTVKVEANENLSRELLNLKQ